jgi:hypothetical protein
MPALRLAIASPVPRRIFRRLLNFAQNFNELTFGGLGILGGFAPLAGATAGSVVPAFAEST